MKHLPLIAAGALATGLLTSPGAARAETYHTCAGVISSVPTTISTQGVWCMDHDLASNLASGALITIAANNVTIDCNGYKLGGLGAGPGTQTIGIQSTDRSNIAVRGCNLRGFRRAIMLGGVAASGISIVGNRIDGSTENSVWLYGSGGNEIRDNLVLDSGGSPTATNSFAIYVTGDVDIVGNRVEGVVPATAETTFGSYGIAVVSSSSAIVRGNRVRGIDGGSESAYGIAVYGGTFATMVDNDVSGVVGGGLERVSYYCGNDAIVADNRAYGTATFLFGCDDDGGNISKVPDA